MPVYNGTISIATEPSNRFEKLLILGSGSYGTVYCCRDRKNNSIVAVKRSKTNTDEGLPGTSIREIACLKRLRHPNIVKLYGVYLTESRLALVFEYVKGGDLDNFIRKYSDFAYKNNINIDNNSNYNSKNSYGSYIVCPSQSFGVGFYSPEIRIERANSLHGIPLEITKYIIKQILYGLYYAHENHIIHRDIKPSNILVDENTGIIKICDFGLSRQVCIPVEAYSNNVTTLFYRAPEILLGETNYSDKIDIWSTGIILAECFRGKNLFQAKDEIDAFIKICQIFGRPTKETWPNAFLLPNWGILEQSITNFSMFSTDNISRQFLPGISDDGFDLFSKMCEIDPIKRISAADALKHPFFNDKTN